MLLVFLSHSIGDILPGGFVGVDVFFALSGYLITSLLVREWQTQGGIHLRNFYVRRALRLYPALLLAVVGVAAVTPLVGFGWPGYAADAATALTYTYNFWGFVGHHPSIMGPLWSLCVEEQYYLLWPILLIVFLRRGEGAAVRGTAAAAVAAFVLQAVLVPLLHGSLYPLPLGHANELLLGSLLGVVLSTRTAPVLRRLLDWRVAWLAWIPILVAVRLGQNVGSSWLYLGGLAGLAVCSSSIIGHIVLQQSGVMSRLLGLHPVVWLGQRSYAFYLFHVPVILVLRHYGLPYRVVLPAGIAVLAVLIGLSYRFVERPILGRYKGRKAVALQSALG